MSGVYNHKAIEKKWQKKWEVSGIYQAKDFSKKPKFYALIEFPFPSGEGLHTGHIRSNTAMDIIARKRRMEGYNVLYPIGWDAFGLPTENYAIKTGIHPKKVTEKNTNNFRKQLKALGYSFDWQREINTSDPKYYKWTQWIFLQLHKKGLAYKAKQLINWCPVCKIGLANEEVLDNKCERCGSDVVKKEKEQWMLAITKYAERLDKDLNKVDYLERIKIGQRHWIGRSEGLLFSAPVKNTDLEITTFSAHFEAFYADTFVVIAPDHPFLKTLVAGTSTEKEVLAFAEKLMNKKLKIGYSVDKESEGIFTGRYISDPVSNSDLPIWIANYAIAEYGTGIVKASCHDERDFKFAKKYKIKLKPVLFPSEASLVKKVKKLEICYSDMVNGILSEPKEFAGQRAGQCRQQIADLAVRKKWAKRQVTYRLRDWVFSRQRYWGEPIPIIHCQKCGIVPVPEKDLPVKLPELKDFQPTDSGESPLVKAKDWVEVKCPTCSGLAKRETDTMPNWAGSSWYFLRYVDPKNDKELATAKKLKYWLPVDWYNGGMEHTTLHLLYSRFWHKFLYDIGIVSSDEPYYKRTSHGMILGEGGIKMSKSKGNVVNPDDIAQTYGADTLRIYEMFMGPFDAEIAWDTKSIIGSRRFLERIWRLIDSIERVDKKSNDNSNIIHQTIKKVTEDIEAMSFNTAVSSLMILLNTLEKNGLNQSDFKIFLQLLAPFAPHITDELWFKIGQKKSIHLASWPLYDPKKLEANSLKIIIQVNNKNRDNLLVAKNTTEAEIKKQVLARPLVKKWIGGKSIKKVIYVKDRLVNIVAV